MLLPSAPSDKNKTPLSLLTIAILLLIFLIAPAIQAQLTQEDIDALRERGKEEGWTFTVGLCEANTKYSLEELCGFNRPDNWYDMAPHTTFTSLSTMAAPTLWDWREYDGVSAIKNQGNCGSCWAFGTLAPLECAIKIRDGISVDLAEQWLLSCNKDGWDCDGGFFAHDYLVSKNDLCRQTGAVMESDFPYAATELPCECPYERHYWIDSWAYIGNSYTVPATEDIKQAVMTYGPVSVGVFVNDAWYGYSGGIFNACEVGNTNHAVAIVGWDDNFQGSGVGVWIVKNSWGADWGDDGFIYMPYGCSLIGEGACYIEFDLPGFFFWADTTFGWAPVDVNFEAYSPLTVDSWHWDFGDGTTADVQIPPTHTYTENGSYDVSLQAVIGGETRTITKPVYVIAVADTIRGDNVTTDPDTDVEFVVYANNSAPIQYLKIPVEFGNTFGMTYDSFSTAGCRTDYFYRQDYLHYDIWFGKRLTLRLQTDPTAEPDLAPGEGPIVKLYFSVPSTAPIGSLATIQLDGYDIYLPAYYGEYADYQVPAYNGTVTVGAAGCCATVGDINHDGSIDPLDVTYFVDWIWKGGADIPCLDEADSNGDSEVDPLDLTYLVAYIWQSGPPPVGCP
ncbi:MAG: C1 family peptidase [Candidatus Zixiibacteriota bacterium]